MKKYLFEKLTSFFLLNTITKCDELLLSNFIRCIEKKEFKALKRFHFWVPDIFLQYAWGIVFEEYCTLSNNSGYEEFFLAMKQLYKLDSKIMAIHSALNVLVHGYDKKCVDILCRFGYNFNFNFEDKKEYYSDLNKVMLKYKSVMIERERAKKLFESLSKEQKTKDTGTRYFSASLITLSKYMGYRLDPKKITVTEFASISSQYEKEIIHLMNKK